MSEGTSKGSGFFNLLFDIRRNQEAAGEIDSILLDLRCRGLLSHSPGEISKIVFMSVPFVWLVNFLLLPLSIPSNIKSIIFSLALSFIPFYFLNGFTLFDYLILSLICLILYNIKEVSQSALILILDIIDLVSAGRLTKIFLKFYKNLDEGHKKSLITNRTRTFFTHLYASRQLLHAKITRNWEDYFVSVLKYFPEDNNLLRIEIDRYWKEIEDIESIYNKSSPLYLSDHLDWIETSDFPRATLATLRLVLRNLDDIDGLRSEFTGNGITSQHTLLGTALRANVPLVFIKEIVEAGADVNFPQPDLFGEKKIPIIYNAISNSSREVVEYLIEAGADIAKATAAAGLSIYQHAILWAKEVATLKLLLDASGTEDFQDKNGNGLFHYAAVSVSDRTAFMQVLLERKHDINAANNKGLSPLGEAASFDLSYVISGPYQIINLQNIIFLNNNIKKGAILNNKNDTFLHIFIEESHSTTEEIREEIIDYFLNDEFNINHQNDEGETILIIAARRRSFAILKQILRCNPNLQIEDKFGCTAFQIICNKRIDPEYTDGAVVEYIELVDLFLDKGENIHQRDRENRILLDLIDLRLNDALKKQKKLDWLTDEERQKDEEMVKGFLTKFQQGISAPDID